MFPGKVHYLRHFCFSDLVGINPTFSDPMMVNVQHNARRCFAILVKEPLEHVDDEFHRRVIVVKQEDAIEVWPFCLGLGLGNDRCARTARITFALTIVIGQPWTQASALISGRKFSAGDY
jgi:hypothetical protein